MARAFSKMKAEREAFLLLRAVAFRQGTPRELLKSRGYAGVARMLAEFIAEGIVVMLGDVAALTEKGWLRLRQVGNGKPPMIDVATTALRSRSSQDIVRLEAADVLKIVNRTRVSDQLKRASARDGLVIGDAESVSK